MGNLFISATAAGEGMGIVPIPAEYKDTGVINKKDNVNIARTRKVKRLIAKMKTNEKNVLQQKRWATQLPTPPLP